MHGPTIEMAKVHEFMAEPLPEAPSSSMASFAPAVQARNFMDTAQKAEYFEKEIRHLGPNSNLTQV